MRRSLLWIVASALVLAQPIALLAQSAKLDYPPAPRGDVVDTYFGVKVHDPYRWLESIDSPQTRTWVKAEAALSRSYLDAIPQRATIRGHLKHIVNYEKIGTPWHVKNHYFFRHNSGLQNQDVLYTRDGPHGAPRVLIDPNALSADGTVALGATAASESGAYLAYATQSSGSDWETWHVKNVETGKGLPDVLQWSKFSGASWRGDVGFYYDRYAAPVPGQTYKAALYDQKVYFHRLGMPQSADTLVYENPKVRNAFYGTQVTNDGRYLVLTTSLGTSINNTVDYEDLRARNPRFVGIFTKNDAQYSFIDNVGTRFYFQTTLHAPNGRVIEVDLAHPTRVTTVVPQSTSALQSAGSVGHTLYCSYLKDAHSEVLQYDMRGRFLRTIALPGIGTASGFYGWPDDRVTYYSFSGYTTPPVNYELNVATGRSTVYSRPKIAFDAVAYTTKEIFYRSKDGTRVPMMISYRKGLKLDGANPTILYGYGGFDIPITPYFSPMIATWLQMGGVYAVANIRGGSEYGEAWHKAGMLAHKQNVFDDFIAAAEYLIAQRYTSTPKLAISGASNGGLLIGAAETQRPDLFGAALPSVGVMDMLRFQDFTIGNAWISEYGCSTCSKAQFETLYKYSPYQNIRQGVAYPPTLISTADHDDRVFPAHSFKFAAKMQWAQAGEAPILLRVDTKSGHGGGKPLDKIIDDYADAYAFLVKNLHTTLPASFKG